MAHSEACRKRLTEAIAESDEGKERIQAAENRALEYQDRVLEAQMNNGAEEQEGEDGDPGGSSAGARLPQSD